MPLLSPVGERELCARIRAEFLEMPCLRLTLAQAARLFHLDLELCARVLKVLVNDGLLTFRDGLFMLPHS